MQPINFKFSNEFTRKGVSTKRFDFSKVSPCKVEDEMNALMNEEVKSVRRKKKSN